MICDMFVDKDVVSMFTMMNLDYFDIWGVEK